MGISTTGGSNAGNKPLDKKAKIALLLEHHRPLLEKMGVPDPHFCPKMGYYDSGDFIVAFFQSEIEKGTDIYLEFVSAEYEPKDPENRKLYKWLFNKHYDTEYRKAAPHPAITATRYLVPVEELIECEDEQPFLEEDQLLEAFDLPNPDEDAPLSLMTVRDFAAIMLKKPVSKKKWLNDLIK